MCEIFVETNYAVGARVSAADKNSSYDAAVYGSSSLLGNDGVYVG